MTKLSLLTPRRRDTAMYRMQAVSDGRGPWRPGFSRHWTDETRTDLPTDWMTAFGLENVLRKIPTGWHAGCACRSLEQLARWFSLSEQRRLESMGFAVVLIQPDLLIDENDDQAVIARKTPFNVGAVAVPWRAAA